METPFDEKFYKQFIYNPEDVLVDDKLQLDYPPIENTIDLYISNYGYVNGLLYNIVNEENTYYIQFDSSILSYIINDNYINIKYIINL